MKGSPAVIVELNKNLEGELTAINQYLLHSGMFRNWGYSELAKRFMDIAKQEREHSEELITRILFLGGQLTSVTPAIDSTTDVRAILAYDLDLEQSAFQDYNNAANIAIRENDNGSRELFTHILAEEEKHINFFESQIHQIDQIGLENYLASQM